MTTAPTAVVRLPVAVIARLKDQAALSNEPIAVVLGRLLELPSAAVPPSRPAQLSATTAGSNLDQIVSTRLTREQFEVVAQRATDCALPLAAYVRLAVLGVTPRQQLPLATQAVVHLARIGNNLNQLTRLANTGTVFSEDLLRVLQEALDTTVELRNALSEESSP